MHDLMRANGLKQYAGRRLAIGDEFIVDARHTKALLTLGCAELVRRDVDQDAAPQLVTAAMTAEDEAPPVKRGRGRPKGSTKYKRRDMTAEP